MLHSLLTFNWCRGRAFHCTFQKSNARMHVMVLGQVCGLWCGGKSAVATSPSFRLKLEQWVTKRFNSILAVQPDPRVSFLLSWATKRFEMPLVALGLHGPTSPPPTVRRTRMCSDSSWVGPRLLSRGSSSIWTASSRNASMSNRVKVHMLLCGLLGSGAKTKARVLLTTWSQILPSR